MPTPKTLKKITLALALATTAVMAQTPYDEGQKALRGQDWMGAVAHFQEATKDDTQADAATYWMAYAYYKAGRRNEAERELRRLERKYPDSSWVKEGQALRIEHQDPENAARAVAAAGELDDELRLFALMQLMERDPERTMPLVLDLVHESGSASVRRDALFILAMNEDETSRKALSEIAASGANPELQRHAIEMLGVMEATEELHALYPSQQRDAKVRIIEALSIAGDTAMLRQVLETETDPALRKAAIMGIAIHGDGDAAGFAEEIYRAAESVDEKITVLESMIMMDNAQDMALKILRTEDDPRLQMHAIHILGVMEATGELAEIYTTTEDRNVRTAILEALSIAEDSDSLVRIIEAEKDPELRAVAVQMLAVQGSPEATRYLVDMYPAASREDKSQIIHSMLILEDSDALLALMKAEEDPGLKREMLQILTVMGSEEEDEALFELLENEK